MTATKAHALGLLIPKTRRILAPLAPRRGSLPLDIAYRQSTDKRFTLRAQAWTLKGYGIAECRSVVICGHSVCIVNILIFPVDGWRIPVFVADYIAIGGKIRLVFVDLQTVGLSDQTRQVTADRTHLLLTSLPPRLPAPSWATNYSTGHYFYRRPEPNEIALPLVTAMTDYLRTWVELTQTTSEHNPALMNDELQCFKANHLSDCPAEDYMTRLFGPVWTRRFMSTFLYA